MLRASYTRAGYWLELLVVLVVVAPCGLMSFGFVVAWRAALLLDGHGEVEAVFGFDQVVVVLEADVDLDPVDLAVEGAGVVVGGDRGAVLVAHVQSFVAGEQQGFVVPALTPSQLQQLAAGSLSLDALTRRYVHDRLGYQYVVTADGATLELTAARLAHDFAAGLMLADARRPRWAAYQPGIGPYTEPKVVALVLAELRRDHPALYGSVQTGASYPNSPRQKCDLLITPSGGRSWRSR